MVIDAHQHFWNLDKIRYGWLEQSGVAPIRRTIEAPELEPQLRAAGIDKTVLVQSLDSYEDTDYMLEIAARYEWVAGVVGWVPLDRPDEAARKLAQYAQNRLFKGVRHLIHDEADPDWVVREEVIEGLKVLASFGMSFDMVAVFPNHLKHVPTLAEKVPGLHMVIDHLAKPPIRGGEWEPWASQLARAASYPGVYAKISGLNTAADWESWTSESFRPYIHFAIERFGADRLMYGSDWPVCTLAGDYAKVWRETKRALADCSKRELEAIVGGTATAFYRLQHGDEERRMQQ